MVEYAKKTVAELQEILKGHGLQHTGKKAELVARLQERDKSAEANAVPEPALATETTPAPPSKPAPEPASKTIPTPAAEPSTTSEPSKPTTAEPAAPSPDTALAATTNYALNLPAESLDDEAMRRKRRAERFGTGQPANGEADEEEKKKVARAEKFGAGEAGLGKLNEALPMEREKGRKRGQGGGDEESHALDDPGLIRRGRGRGGFRGRARSRPGRGGGGGRGGTPDRPTGVSKPAYINDKDKLAAEARKKRFAAQS